MSAHAMGRWVLTLALAAGVVACGGGSGNSGMGGGAGGGTGGGYGGGGTPPPTGGGTAGPFTVTKLVSDGSVSAQVNDAHLKNPWGIVFAPGAPVWIANNGTQTSTLYDGTGTVSPPTVAIPPGMNGAANPTGIVFNSGSAFQITANGHTAPALFIFDGEGGTLSGWSDQVDAQNAVTAYDDGAGNAVYKGLALASDSSGAHLYATDFHNNKVDIFDSTFHKVTLAGSFKDPNLPAAYAPFGIQALSAGGQTLIYVTFAQQQAPDNHDNVNGAGLGLIDIFDTQGNFKSRLVSPGGKLNAPWGLALAPTGFGSFGGDLLVGNFGDGAINAYDPKTGTLVGTIEDANKQTIAYPGLWGIAFGNGALNQPASTLFFAAGIAAEADGVYGRIDAGTSAPDVTAPTVSLSAPAAGATVSGSVTVTAAASDAGGVASVTIKAGSAVIATLTTAPYTTTWNTTTVANGAVTLTAVATDKAGNSATSAAVSVTVSNNATPQVTLSQLQTSIFTPICSVCHTGTGSSLPGVMNLTAGHTYTSLINVASIEQPTLKRVAPGSPDNSYVVHKIEGSPGITGGRMPLGGPYLDQATIDQVRAWITQGAQNN